MQINYETKSSLASGHESTYSKESPPGIPRAAPYQASGVDCDPSNMKIPLHLHQLRKNDQNDNASTTKAAANIVLIDQRVATLLCRESTLENPQLLTLSQR